MRCFFPKLRLSAHNLHIETGRYRNRNIPREERYCLFCKTKNDLVIEDEIHFLTCCPLFATEREEMINSISEKYPSIKMLNTEKLLIWLLSQEDTACLELVGNFCKNSFKKREKELKIINRAWLGYKLLWNIARWSPCLLINIFCIFCIFIFCITVFYYRIMYLFEFK